MTPCAVATAAPKPSGSVQIDVRVVPGDTVATRTPWSPTSSARALLKAVSAALAVVYGTGPVCGIRAPLEDTLTIRPCRASRPGMAARQARTAEKRLSSNVRCQVASS